MNKNDFNINRTWIIYFFNRIQGKKQPKQNFLDISSEIQLY